MKINFWRNNENWIAGITLKDEKEYEQNNMALHACKNPELIIENRKKLATHLQCQVTDFVCAEQTHSDHFHKATEIDRSRGAIQLESAIPNTDALYTDEPNLLLCGFSADCVPVLFYHEEQNLVGVIHSGWKGTVQEISLKLFQHLIENEQCAPNGFHVFIGPALNQEKFEVDEDVYVQFKALGYADDLIKYNEKTGKYHIDNQQTVKKQLIKVGIPEEHVEIDPTCTYTSTDGFSYREDKQSGRHLAFIMKK